MKSKFNILTFASFLVKSFHDRKRPRRCCSLHRRDVYGVSIKHERLAKTFLALAKVLGLFLDDAEDDDQYESWLGLKHVCFYQFVRLEYVASFLSF